METSVARRVLGGLCLLLLVAATSLASQILLPNGPYTSSTTLITIPFVDGAATTTLADGTLVATPGIPDAYLAALALEQGATLVTADRGFARYEGLRLLNPLAS